MENLRKVGLTVATLPGGTIRATRENCAVDIREEDGKVRTGQAGMLIGDEIGALVDGGYQKFFRTPSGKNKPALADELKALHNFEEDLREGLGKRACITSRWGRCPHFICTTG
jgi:hypothetical protein